MLSDLTVCICLDNPCMFAPGHVGHNELLTFALQHNSKSLPHALLYSKHIFCGASSTPSLSRTVGEQINAIRKPTRYVCTVRFKRGLPAPHMFQIFKRCLFVIIAIEGRAPQPAPVYAVPLTLPTICNNIRASLPMQILRGSLTTYPSPSKPRLRNCMCTFFLGT